MLGRASHPGPKLACTGLFLPPLCLALSFPPLLVPRCFQPCVVWAGGWPLVGVLGCGPSSPLFLASPYMLTQVMLQIGPVSLCTRLLSFIFSLLCTFSRAFTSDSHAYIALRASSVETN